MYRIVGGVLALLLAIPAAWAEDKPKDKAPTPAEQYKALLKQYQDALNAYMTEVRKAKTPEEQRKAFEKYPKADKLAPKFLALAEKNPKDPIALDALIWVATNGNGRMSAKGPRARAIALLSRDYLQSDKLGRVCQSVAYTMDKENEKFLRAVLEKNQNKNVRAEACLALAQNLRQQAATARLLQGNAQLVKAYENIYGKDQVAELVKADVARIETQSEKAFKDLADKHIPQLGVERVKSLCQTLSYSGAKGSDILLRALLEKDKRRDVRGAACLALAQVLKQRAEGLTPTDDKAGKKLKAESEKLFERAVAKYADVKLSFYGTVGAKAKSELFDIRHLSVGQLAPAVEGVDQDGKKFKLGDYKGKVVLLDFWSQY
jgi:hypothetical protein